MSEGTINQYGSTYKQWWPFCAKIGISPFSGNATHVITFLQELLDNGKSVYGTFNSHRSALSLITSADLGSDPTLTRFLKGIFKLRPPRPRYNFVWDPQKVLDYLENTSSDTLRSLSHRLITLLALTTAHRIQTFSLIKISNIVDTESGFQIPISDPVKTSGVNKIQPCLHIPLFAANPKLCVASTLKEYLIMTKDKRPPGNDFLFITTQKPYRTANKQTLSRWVKETLGLAGIDTNIFKAHSTRHASTSAALRQGVSIDVIRQTAGWTQQSTVFANVYNRPLSNVRAFSDAILS